MAIKAKRSPKPMSPRAGVKPNSKRYGCGGKLYKCGGKLKRKK